MSNSNKPVLLYIITKSELGGAQSHIYDLITNFCADYQVHLATGSTGVLTNRVESLGVPTYLIANLNREINLLKDFLAIKECIKLISKIKPDIIHLHSSKAGIVGRFAGFICRIPTIFTVHGWGFTSGVPMVRRTIAMIAEKLLSLFTFKIICVSEYDRQLAIKLGIGNQNSLVTIHNGIDITSSGGLKANPSIQPPKLVMVARFDDQKDQKTLLEAMQQLSINVHLNLIGDGVSFNSCKILAQSLKITEQVSFLGSRTDVPHLLAESQIFILSTHYEGLPISILEAMRSGLPIIATNVNGIPEAVIHGKTGLLVPPRDVKSLTDALQTLVNSPELRQRMGEASKIRFEQEFTIEHMIDKIKVIYEQIIKNNHGFKRGL